MKLITKTLAAATLAIGAFATPALATDDGAIIMVDLWDAGSNMQVFDNHRIINGVPRYEDSMGVMISTAIVPAGEVTFKVFNSSADFEHEMVVGVLPDMAVGLPYDEDTLRVNEDIDGANLGEVPELQPGTSGGLTIRLKAGTYVLYCNIGGHYASGMWTILTVE